MESKIVVKIKENPDGYGHLGYEYFPIYFREGIEDLSKKMNLNISSLNKKDLGM